MLWCSVWSTWFFHYLYSQKNVSGYVCNHGSLRVGNETLRPLGVAMGERRQRDPCLKHTYKNTTCWPATAYDVTTGANHSIKGRRENTSSTSSSEACVRSMAPRLEDAVSRSLLSGNHGYIRNLRRSLSRELRTASSRGRYGEQNTHAAMLRGMQAKHKRRALSTNSTRLRELPLGRLAAVRDIIPYGQRPELHTLKLTC